MKLDTAYSTLTAYFDANIPAFLWGAPGVGKSDLIRQFSADRRLPLIDVRAVLLDPVDLRGLPHVENGRAAWAPPAFLPNAERDGAEGTFFLDELNAAPPSVQAACFQLVLDRKLGEYTLPPGWRIVAAGNRQSDRAAAQRMPSALANRFAHIDVEPDVDAWAAWAARSGLHAVVAAFIRFRPGLLHIMPCAQPNHAENLPAIPADARAFPTPRAWAQVAKVADAPDAVRPGLVAGLVGEGPAAEFEGFVRTWRKLPALSLILSDPHGAPVPNDPASMYAVTAAIARKADRANFANVLAYAGRLPREFEIVAAVDAIKRAPDLAETGAFTAWAVRNQDVTI